MGSSLSLFNYNIFEYFFPKKLEGKIIMIGLDAVGKTTILYKLKLGESITTIPTIGFNVETVDTPNISLVLWDVGGRDRGRPLMQKFTLPDSVAMIYVLDTTQYDRLDEAKDEFFRNINDEAFSKDAKILILSNKKDLESYREPGEIIEKWELNNLKFQWRIQPCSAMTGEGLLEGIEWLSNELTKK